MKPKPIIIGSPLAISKVVHFPINYNEMSKIYGKKGYCFACDKLYIDDDTVKLEIEEVERHNLSINQYYKVCPHCNDRKYYKDEVKETIFDMFYRSLFENTK